jgi:hypothetical protein
LSRYRGLSRHGLITWLLDIGDPLHNAPLLRRTRDWWLNVLPATPTRKCLTCKAPFWSRDDVGALLFSTPATSGIGAGSASIVGVCRECWGSTDRPGVSIAAIEDAGTKLLRHVVENGAFEPLQGVS